MVDRFRDRQPQQGVAQEVEVLGSSDGMKSALSSPAAGVQAAPFSTSRRSAATSPRLGLPCTGTCELDEDCGRQRRQKGKRTFWVCHRTVASLLPEDLVHRHHPHRVLGDL